AEGRPWSERKRYVWWDEGEEEWTSLGDEPDFVPDKAPDYRAPEGAKGMEAINGDAPFILHADGLGWLYAPRSSPTRQIFDRPENPYNPADVQPGAEVFPYVLGTYRLTEHHTAGGM